MPDKGAIIVHNPNPILRPEATEIVKKRCEMATSGSVAPKAPYTGDCDFA